MAPLLAPAVAFHAGSAALAAATAWSTFCSEATWTLLDTVESSFGLRMDRVSSVLDFTYYFGTWLVDGTGSGKK